MPDPNEPASIPQNLLALSPGGELALSAAAVPELADALGRATGGASIRVFDAVRSVENGNVVVRGKADFLGVAKADVLITAAPGDSRVVIARFTLIEGVGTPGANWTFGRSFPDLPPFSVRGAADFTGADPAANVLDTLVLADAAFVLASVDGGVDPVNGCPLQAGLNFTSRMSPTGLLGLIGSLVTGGDPLPFYGPIVIPKPGETTLPPPLIPAIQLPWRQTSLPPGIHLKGDLGEGAKLGSALNLHDLAIRLYTPITSAWADANREYGPILAADATLDIPSAQISLEVTALGIQSPQNLLLFGEFQGVTLGKMADLADLAGAGDLASHLPDDVRAGLDTLARLELETVTLQLGPGLSVVQAGVAIGIRDLKTTIVPGFEVDSLVANFAVSQPFGTKRSLSVSLGGRLEFLDTPFDVSVEYPDIYAAAQLDGDIAIPIGRLFTEVGLPDAPDLTINALQLQIGGDGSYAVAAAIADDPPWTMDLGPTDLTVKDVAIVVNRPKGGSAKANIGGTIELGDDFSLTLAYDSPGDFLARAELPDARLLALVGRLTNQALPLPDGFDIALSDNIVLIRKSGNDYELQLATMIDGAGALVFEARKTIAGGSSWGFALGFDMADGALSKLANLCGLAGIEIFDSLFSLDQLTLVVSSFDDPGFTFPALAAFNSPALPSTGAIRLPSAGGVIAGLNVHARWKVGDSREQALLRTLLGLGATLDITLQIGTVPSRDSRLYVGYETTIQGMPFRCQFGGQIKDGSLGLFLTGHLEASIQGGKQTFDVTLLFVANGAFISGSMLGTIDFGPFELSNLAVVIGSNWEGVPSLGIACTLTIPDFQSSLAVFFDSAEPSKSMLAGAVSDLTLNLVVTKLAGAVLPDEIASLYPSVKLVGTHKFQIDASLADDLDNLKLDSVAAAFAAQAGTLPPLSSSASQVLLNVGTPGQSWFLTDLTHMYHYELTRADDHIEVALNPQFYFAPQTTSLGALKYEEGVFITTGLEMLFFKAEATILIKPSQGIYLEGEVERLVILSDKLFALESSDGSKGPKLSGATYSRADETDPELAKPHLLIDGCAKFLGSSQTTRIYIGASGIDIKLENKTLLIDYKLTGRLNGPTDFSMAGSVKFGVGTLDLGPMGSVDIDTGINGEIAASLKGAEISVSLSGGFEFAGATLDFPTIPLDFNAARLDDLGSEALDAVVDALKAFFLGAPERWAKAVADGVVKGVEDAAKVLEETFGKAADEARQIAEDAGNAVKDIGEKVADGAKDAGKCAMSTAASLF
jgi:hypothetical protein